MENSIYLGLSRQLAIRSNMDVVANNIANMNTSGFRAQNLVFEEYISDPAGADDPLSFSTLRGQYDNTDPGSISITSDPLNIALEGPGFIGIQGPGGETAYTRDGTLRIDPSGILITQAGFPVAGEGGGNIVIPSDSVDIQISSDGAVSNQSGTIGTIQISEFENPQVLAPMGANLYSAEGAAPIKATETTVLQGALEDSNVNGVVEMTRMIEISREYESLNNLLSDENDRLRNAIQTLTSSN